MTNESQNLDLEKENKRLLELLKDSENQRLKENFLLQKLNLFNENVPLAVIEWDMNSCVTEWNKSAETIFGYSKKEALGKRASELIVPESLKEQIDKLWKLLYKNLGGTRSTNDNTTKTGQTISCDWYNTPIFNDKGKIIGISSMVLDITEKVKTKAELGESNTRYKMLSELTFEGIVVYKNGIAIEANASLENLTQYNRNELIGQDIVDLIVSEEYIGLAKENTKNKHAKPYELKIRKKNGDLFWAEVEAKSILYQGLDIRTVAIRNIEKRKSDEQKLQKALLKAQESDRLKSAFLATISHELRTPLNAIIGFSNLIDENMDIEEAASLAKMIFKSGNHLLEIINDIFDLSVLEEGTMILLKEKHNLHKLMNEIQEYIFLEKQKTNKEELELNFIFHSVNDDIQINTDAKRFKQIFIHLLKNALKYTKEGSIEVGYELLPDEIKFYVKDTGIGIAQEKQQSIFEFFRQMDDSHTREFEGTGIGLSIAKTLCENLEGKISLESELGQGSTFYFTIPYKKEWSEKHENKTNPIIDLSILNGKTILIAEDNADSYELLERHLKRLKVDILWAKNGIEAIYLFNMNKNIDLILMDIKMPSLSGYKATKEIRRTAPEVPIIAQTAYALNDEKETALEAGCDDYISKPINWNTLTEKMVFHLQKAKK